MKPFPKQKVNFVLKNYAIGDYVCFMTALKWVEQTQKHVDGVIWAPDYFIEIPRLLFKGTRFEVRDIKTILQSDVANTPTYVSGANSSVNAAGSHQIDLGFAFFTNHLEAPFGWGHYVPAPRLNESFQASKYVVVTPGHTNELREMKPELFRRLMKYITEELQLDVVLLGKTEMTSKHKSTFCDDARFFPEHPSVMNLIDRTTLWEALAYIQHAQTIVGIDNGLMHLAGMTDTPIVMGYTVASPEYRRIRRPSGKVWDVVIPMAMLNCRHCMSNMRYVYSHDTNTCWEGDKACVNIMAGDYMLEKWKTAISEAVAWS